MARRGQALLISAETFKDPTISRLKSPSVDVRELASVLKDPAIGNFGVETMVDRPSHEVKRRIEEFYGDCHAEDLLLLYVSCHGHRDGNGHLYFVCGDTELRLPRSTSLPSAFIREIAQDSNSRRQALIFDSCFSGAFPKGMMMKNAGTKLDSNDFPGGGHGQVILTASTAFQYSLDGNDVEGSAQPSLFTKHLIEGLRSGNADLNNDGVVDLDELYQYAYDRTRSEAATQTPQRWVFQSEGKMLEIAWNPYPRKGVLSSDLRQLLDHSNAQARILAVDELSRLLHSGKPAENLVARDELQKIAKDNDSFTVRQAAATALASEKPDRGGRPAPKQPHDLAAFVRSWRDRGKQPLTAFEFRNTSGGNFQSAARVGESCYLRIRSPRPGFLTLLMKRRQQNWQLAYPGWRWPGLELQENRDYRFPQDLPPFPAAHSEPDRWEFAEPGTEVAIALCSSAPLIKSRVIDSNPDSLPDFENHDVMSLLGDALEMPDVAFSRCGIQVVER